MAHGDSFMPHEVWDSAASAAHDTMLWVSYLADSALLLHTVSMLTTGCQLIQSAEAA